MNDKATTGRKGASGGSSKGFTAEEIAAMKERARELKAESSRARGKKAKADGEADLLAKIAEMPEADRAMAERIHALVKSTAPTLMAKTWYGMPAWANEAGKVVCYFTPAAKFKERYATFGFNAEAALDDGNMWPTSFALLKLTAAEEGRITDLVSQAAGLQG